MQETKYMRRCFELAQKGLGNVAPNPMVGAVIVHNGEIIGEGYHMQWGGPHAEVNAIASVTDQSLLKKSTIYVSLEPCSHYGKTPPCAKLIIEKGIPGVVIANVDPFPEVSGRGIRMLQEAGIKVRSGLLEEEGWLLNKRFFTFHEQKRPFVILKWAQSEDGFMDQERANGEQAYHFSNEETSKICHQLRANESAILVGTNTALLDNPSLTVRHVAGKNPTRILIDKDLRIPQSFNIYNGEAPTLIFTEKEKKSVEGNITYVTSDFKDGKLPIKDILEELYSRKLQSVIVEGGRSILQSFIEENLWDEMHIETVEDLYLRNGVPAPHQSGTLFETVGSGKNIVRRYRNNL